MAWVYLVHQENSNLYKLGRTNNLVKRLQVLRSNNPSIKLICTIETNYSKTLENKLLARLRIPIEGKQRKVKGEWVELSPEWVKVIIFEMETRFAEF